MLRINKQLHLVIPIFEGDEGSKIVAYVHSTPLSEATLDRFWEPLAKTYAQIFTGGFGIVVGPAQALRILRKVAADMNISQDVELGVVEEFRRLTNVEAIDPETGQWVRWPFAHAVGRGIIDEEDKREVEAAITFFIVGCANIKRAQRTPVLKAAAELWGAHVTSSPFTEWSHSSATSTGTESSGASDNATQAPDTAPEMPPIEPHLAPPRALSQAPAPAASRKIPRSVPY